MLLNLPPTNAIILTESDVVIKQFFQNTVLFRNAAAGADYTLNRSDYTALSRTLTTCQSYTNCNSPTWKDFFFILLMLGFQVQ